MNRRAFFRRTLGALVASQLPVRSLGYGPYVAASTGPFVPRYWETLTFEGKAIVADSYAPQLAELNAVTIRQMMPVMHEYFDRDTPFLVHLRRRG